MLIPWQDRFWMKVDRRGPDECWEWRAGVTRGYGRFSLGGLMPRSHRIAYELLIGPIPDGLTLDHLCFNTRCVNPAHLEPVTLSENVRRLNARRVACKNGHDFTPENSYVYGGGRHCRTCRKVAVAAYRKRCSLSVIQSRGR